MNKNTALILVPAIVALAALSGCGSDDSKMMAKPSEKMSASAMAKPSDTMSDGMNHKMSPSAMTEPSSTIKDDKMGGKNSKMMSGPLYIDYADYVNDKSKLAGNKAVYFFAASWCPDCRAIDKDLKAGKVEGLKGYTIVKVDYDKASELKKKYGVTMQHTFAVVDDMDKLIKKFSATSTQDLANHLR
ncbi:thioredoxin family protein [Cutibacterium equinum]|uniref:Thioredoxin family protein n=1 Tax=Cutibacterium equinum TaxID=3016342 RepID=A0ABY7QXX4_9ACTN|nr:thioredoxin family protein [Cutibacterium equinum]WCC79097.1 thioredoxin family protein [Cutibacterium equinum]